MSTDTLVAVASKKQEPAIRIRLAQSAIEHRRNQPRERSNHTLPKVARPQLRHHAHQVNARVSRRRNYRSQGIRFECAVGIQKEHKITVGVGISLIHRMIFPSPPRRHFPGKMHDFQPWIASRHLVENSPGSVDAAMIDEATRAFAEFFG